MEKLVQYVMCWLRYVSYRVLYCVFVFCIERSTNKVYLLRVPSSNSNPRKRVKKKQAKREQPKNIRVMSGRNIRVFYYLNIGKERFSGTPVTTRGVKSPWKKSDKSSLTTKNYDFMHKYISQKM